MRRQGFHGFVAAATTAALMLAACGGSGGGSEGSEDSTQTTSGGSEDQELGGKLVISNWDAYMPKNLIPSFEKKTGVDVEVAVHTTNEDIMGKIQAQSGTGFDLVFVSGQFVEPLVQQGWAAEVDPSQISNLENLYPRRAVDD
ncbi:MAG: extracellular solute-binding protein [Actinobacteria bacterium]|nr:extracellular solute-binding protein [Actinomycetota bacterium]